MKYIYLVTAVLLLHLSKLSAQVYGCTDALATNFNLSATVNDGSCIYPAANIGPTTSVNLPASLSESSGLVLWNQQLWTQNDNSDTSLYTIDSLSGLILLQAPLPGVVNNDWEEISQDSTYLYIGDFGNNANGNRTNLNILRIDKSSVTAGTPLIDTINFFYADQTSFTPTGANNTDFDCEAFVVTSDSIYLFTKQWVGTQTVCYTLPKTPGSYSALPCDTLNVAGLITGATLLGNERIVMLCGYNGLLQPFVYLLYDFTGQDFFGGNKRKVNVTLPFHQIESIATAGYTRFYMTNEHFSQPPIINVDQQLHMFDLNAYLGGYIDSLTSGSGFTVEKQSPLIYPNPATDYVSIESINFPMNFNLLNASGEIVLQGRLTTDNPGFSVAELKAGVYFWQGEIFKEALPVVIKR